MATRITEMDTHVGIQGRLGFTFRRRYCSDCGKEVPSLFSCTCPNCGQVFDSQQIIHLPERKANA